MRDAKGSFAPEESFGFVAKRTVPSHRYVEYAHVSDPTSVIRYIRALDNGRPADPEKLTVPGALSYAPMIDPCSYSGSKPEERMQ